MIHNLQQLPNFPAFTWSQDALNPLLMNLRGKQGKILCKMDALLIDFRNEANKEMLVAETYATLLSIGSAIEQNKVRDLVTNKLNLNFNNSLIVIDKNLDTLVDLLLDASKNYKQELNKEQLIQWHNTISQLQVSDNINPPPILTDEQEKQLDRFLLWFNKPGLDRLMKAAIAHLWFQTISPFINTSKVLAGFISNIQLAKADATANRYYSITTQIFQEEQEYHFILAQTQNGSLDITIWLQWFLGCLERSYDNAEKILSPLIVKANYWNQKMDVVFNKRQKTIVQKLLDNNQLALTTTIYAKLTNCARDTALRDVTNLIQNGILIKEGGMGKNTRYTLKH
jgi:Fic family protein